MAPTIPPKARVVRCDADELTADDHDRIAGFISRYSLYERATLDASLKATSYVWLCLDAKGRLVGTTAVRRIDLAPGTGGHGGRVRVVYTSIVAVNPDFRGLGLPARMGLKTYVHERLHAPFTTLYWLAEAVSPAGYLQMARNLNRFWPKPGHEVPANAQAVIDATLAAAGVKQVRRDGNATLIQEDYPVIEREQAPDRWNPADIDVGFFLRVNPDYWTGSALVMLAPLTFVSVASGVGRALRKVITRARAKP
jgi:GNAT superfamily N-acetyltransferase